MLKKLKEIEFKYIALGIALGFALKFALNNERSKPNNHGNY